MVGRILWGSLLCCLCFHLAAAETQRTSLPAAKPAAQEAEKKDPFGSFHWLTDSRESRGVVVESRRLSSLNTTNLDTPQTEAETEVTRPDARSMRITTRLYGRGASGERILNEVVVEELRATEGDGISATRTSSRNDINGRLRVVRKETQQTVPSGSDTYRTQATVMTAKGPESITRSEEVIQIERKRGAGVVEIERTQMLPDVNGRWAPAERRAGSSREAKGEVLWQEDVYKPDVNGGLALAQQNSGREWKDGRGREHQDTDIYLADLSGRLRLDGRMNVVRSSFADGSEQITQSLFRVSPVSPSEGFKLVQSVQETTRPAASGTRERETELQVPDPNGRLQTVFYKRVQEEPAPREK